MDLDPNMVDGRWALLLIHDGRADDGVAFMQRVATLDPFHRSIYFSYLANGQYLLKRFEASLSTGRLATDRMPEVMQTHVWRAAAAAQVGEVEEARASAEGVVKLNRKFSSDTFVRRINFKRAEDAALLMDGLKKAGLPN